MQIRPGDIVTMKKKHPCGSADWDVLRSGADFRLRCRGCGHQIMLPRTKLEKQLKALAPGTPEQH